MSQLQVTGMYNSKLIWEKNRGTDTLSKVSNQFPLPKQSN